MFSPVVNIHSTTSLLECEKVVYQEAVYRRDNPRERYILPNIFERKEWRDCPWKIAESIARYSSRKLTYDSDALNGVLGVLRRFQYAKYPTCHFWGVPILPPVIGNGALSILVIRNVDRCSGR